MAFRAQTVTLRNEIALSYVERGDPDAPPLLLLPGLGDSWRSYEPVLDHLPSSVRSFACSQRGHGDSSRPSGGYRFRDFVEDLRAFLDTLEIESAVLGGHSSHGLVVEKFAIDHPDRVLGLVLIGTPVTLRSNAAARDLYETTISELTDPLNVSFVRSFAESTLAQPVPQGFLELIYQETMKVQARVFKEFFKDLLDLDLSTELNKITVPALLVWGDQDAILSRREQDTLADALANSRLVIYPGAGHAPHWEHPRRFASDVVGFMSDLISESEPPGAPN